MELYQAIEEFTIKSTGFNKNNYQNKNINKIIGFVYTSIMKLPIKYIRGRCIFK